MTSDGLPHNEALVTIERLRCVYLVSHEHPAPDRLRARLDAVARDRLPAIVGRLLAQLLDGDEAVWLIRRLDVDLALDAAAVDEHALAHIWGRRIAGAVARALARGASGGDVLYFPDRAAYLARFAADLAAGRAWGQWSYAPFDTLRSLPAGTAIREALTREEELAAPVVVRLADQGQLEPVLAVLNDRDARAIYASCRAGVAPGDPSRALIDELLDTWPAVAQHALHDGAATAHNALRLYAAALHRTRSGPTGLGAAIDHVLGLAELLQQGAASEALFDRLAAGDLAGAVGLARAAGVRAGLEHLPFLAQAAGGDRAWLDHIAQTIGPPTLGPRLSPRPAAGLALVTPLAGIFLLLPTILDLGVPEVIATATYPEPEELSTAQALRCLLALKCLGGPHALAALFDPTLAIAVGLDGPPPFDALRRLSEAASADADQACLRRLLAGLAWQGRVEGRCLAGELLPPGPYGQAVLLLREMSRDFWVFAAPASDDQETRAALERGLRMVAEATEAPLACLLLDEDLERLADRDSPALREAQLVPLARPETATGAARAVVARYLAQARPAAPDLASFSLAEQAPPLVANPHFDLTWSLIAQAVIRCFAGRLMGFNWSSAAHLRQNVLASAGSVHVADGRIEVRLPPVPLQVILQMAGVDGQSYTLPWRDDAEVVLRLG